jgi:hypothetical protein
LGFYDGGRYKEFYDHGGECVGSANRHITHWMPAPKSKGAT